MARNRKAERAALVKVPRFLLEAVIAGQTSITIEYGPASPAALEVLGYSRVTCSPLLALSMCNDGLPVREVEVSNFAVR